jgi:hypothetical protein
MDRLKGLLGKDLSQTGMFAVKYFTLYLYKMNAVRFDESISENKDKIRVVRIKKNISRRDAKTAKKFN